MNYYKHHIFFCLNQREDGEACCSDKGAENMFMYMKSKIKSFDLNGATLISNLVFYIIAVIITVTALNQAGIDTQLITNNLTLVLGAFLATFTLAFGLGSREIITDLLKTFYVRKIYEIGQKIKFKNNKMKNLLILQATPQAFFPKSY